MQEPASNPAQSPSRGAFDQEAYLSLYPDVAAAIAAGNVGSAWQHYVLHGAREGRKWVEKVDATAGVSREIAPGDEMFVDNREHYFEAGESALHCIESALFAVGRPKSSIGSILDLPCGFGRVMRFLRHTFPHAQLSACDLQREGVDFCARAFGATALYSHEDPRQISGGGAHDLIWSGSLLTHLERHRCEEFMRTFHRLVVPGGIVVFTLHGRSCAEELSSGRKNYGLDGHGVRQVLEEYHATGFGYSDYPGGKRYGISLSRPDFVLANFVQQLDWKLIGYHESAWDSRQDVVALQRMP